jgi:hypothetical protein
MMSSMNVIHARCGAFNHIGSRVVPRAIFAMSLRAVSHRYVGQDPMKALRIRGQRG